MVKSSVGTVLKTYAKPSKHQVLRSSGITVFRVIQTTYCKSCGMMRRRFVSFKEGGVLCKSCLNKQSRKQRKA